jgi:hypothetical protein
VRLLKEALIIAELSVGFSQDSFSGAGKGGPIDLDSGGSRSGAGKQGPDAHKADWTFDETQK